MPPKGSQPRLMAKMYSRHIDRKKDGMDQVIRENTCQKLSKMPLRFTAQWMPMGMEINNCRMITPTLRMTVLRMGSATTSFTARLFMVDQPKSPWNMLSIQRTYCSGRDLSKPSFSYMAS